MKYVEANGSNVAQWADLDVKMFPELSRAEAERECMNALESGKQTAFLCYDDDGRAVGVVNASIRTDYVEGTDGPPVDYLEAIYVEPKYRNRGIAKELARLAERWAAGRGCREMASDTEFSNLDSQAFHAHIGFGEANRIIAFTKKIS